MIPDPGAALAGLSPATTATAWLGATAVLLMFERARPLRAPTQSRVERMGITAGFAGTSFVVVALAYPLLIVPALAIASEQHFGLVRVLELRPALRAVLAFALLDYSLWLWHWLNHRVPWLWRFHAAHHADLDLDVLTAWRFHLGEMLASMPFRVAQVVVIGVDLPVLLVWELVVLICAQAHHANMRLPARAEARLGSLVITPRLHGIHHATDPRDLGSNFGIILSVWDRLHGLHRFRAEPASPVGLPEIRDARALTLGRALALPFSRRAFARTGVPRASTPR